ncbi:MAG: DUF3078 domain-containing protein [Paludibacteraceae bacterium]|nr:DUF3078 domain-containing protein [Paludibacteraceae bacterium]
MALFVVLFFSFFLLNAQNDTIEIADIENYLESYSISSNQKNLLTTPVVQGSLISPQNQIKISEELKNVDLAKIGFGKLISEKDSLRIAEEAEKECEYNPLFLDWIFRKDNPALEEEKTAENIINNLRREVYIDIKETSPELIAFHEEELPDINDLKLNFSERKTSVEDFLWKQQMVEMPKNKLDISQQKRKWRYGGKISALVSQSYISPNWYTGGTGNVSILGDVSAYVNYTNHKNLQFDNTLEWKAGFNSSFSDSLRFLSTNEDIFKINSKLGLKAFRNFYYTLSAEFSTPLFNTFVPNTRELSTSTFSPIRTYIGLGLDFKYKTILSLMVSPFSYKLTYVMNTSKAEGVESTIADKFNIPEGKNILHAFGSRLELNFAYVFSKELKLNSKFYLYTDYKNVELDWEITGNFIVTHFLTIQLSLHPRYDSSLVLAEGQKSRFQFREFTSLGFLYQF